MQKFNFKYICLIFLFVFLFVGCQNNPNSITITVTETNSIEVLETSIYPRPTTTRGPNATSAPTRTLAPPTVTPTITLTPNPTWVSMRSTETFFDEQFRATQEYIKSLNPALNDCYSMSVSSNNQMFSCNTFDGLFVIFNGGIQQSTISQKDIYPNSNTEIFIVPFKWSKDNVTLYITATTCCKDGPSFLGGNVYNGLWKLNTQKNSVNTIVKNEDEFNSSFYFSISPTERRLIYIDQFENPLTINILDLKENTTDKVIIDNKFERAGRVLWSEDGTQIIFVALSGDNFPFTLEARTSLFWLNIQTLELKKLISDSTHMLTPQNWGEDNIITIRAETGTDYVPTDGSYWYYDLNKNLLLTEKP